MPDDWLPLVGEGLAGYEVHATDPRVRSWRCSGMRGARGERRATPRELTVRDGRVQLRDASGGRRHQSELSVQRLQYDAVRAAGLGVPAPPPTIEGVTERLASVVAALERLQTPPAWVTALEARATALVVAPAAPDQLERPVRGGGAVTFTRGQLAHVVRQLGEEVAARALGVSEAAVRRCLAGAGGVADPERLDRLYVALRADALDGADDLYDAMVLIVSRVNEARRRARLDDAAWSERG